MRIAWIWLALVLACTLVHAGEGKEKKKDQQNSAAPQATTSDAQPEKAKDKEANKAEKAAAKEERKAEKAANKAENESAKASPVTRQTKSC